METFEYEEGGEVVGLDIDIVSEVDRQEVKNAVEQTNKEITKLNKDGFFKTDFNKELKPYFGSEVKASDIIITNDK